VELNARNANILRIFEYGLSARIDGLFFSKFLLLPSPHLLLAWGVLDKEPCKVGDTRNQHIYVSRLYKRQERQNVAFENFQKKFGEGMGSKTLY